MLKKIVIIIILLLVTIGFPIKIGIYYNPPKIIDSKTGIFPEILNYIFEKENIKYNYIFDTFSNLIKKLDNREIDAIACVGFSNERAKKYDFNDVSFMSDWAVVYVNKNNRGITNIFDLKNKKIGVLKKDIYYEDDEYGIKKKLENFDIKSTFVEFYTYDGIFNALSENKIDAGVVNRTYGLLNAEKYNLSPTDIVFSPIKLLMMFRKDYKRKNEIISLIDDDLKRFKEDKNSIYYEIINKYLYVEKINNIPDWVKWIIYISIIIFIGFLADHYFLKKLVEKRTKELREINKELNRKNNELESLNEQIVAQNEELESLYIHNEKLQNSLKLLIKLMADMGESEYISEDSFILKLVETLRFIIPGFKYDKVIKVEKNKKITIVEFGKEKETLRKLKTSLTLSDDLRYEIVHELDEKEINLEYVYELMESFRVLAKAFYRIKNEAQIEEKFREDIIKSLISFLELHDEYTKNHSKNVAKLSKKIAKKMNLDEETQKKVYWAALLHDIGKLIIPNEILNKTSRLTEEEYNKIKMHPVYGFEALIKVENLKEIAYGIKYHHERCDGKGYPDGLECNEIPLIAKIIAVADSWDAMRSRRAYRDPLEFNIALKEIKKNAGIQFSPEVVEAFLKIIKEEGE
ncbi:HD domain-containing phosphohydrolase [Marinitoga lauensis]|uniref:HD domain-containing phosphohydrolase n=1 Tax=Marinitoga lauensis TaxID=2201189 RepID=UPI0010109A98|nr:HD domain-containing phosphohydrolase [Marinitoga lauensis]